MMGRFNTSRYTKVSIALASVLVATAACSGGGNSGGEGGINSEPDVLHIFGANNLLQFGPRQTPEVQKEIQDTVFNGFLEENSNIKSIIWDAQGAQADQEQRSLTARLAGDPIDLYACGVNGLVGYMLDGGLVKPFDQTKIEPIADRFRDTALNDWTVDGELYGVPNSVMSSSTFYYNKDLFQEYGIPDQPSYEDLVEGAKKLTDDGIYMVLHQGSNLPLWPMWYFEALAQTSEDSIAKTQSNLEGTTKFSDPEDIAAFELLNKWVDDGVLSRDSLGVDVEGMRAAFLSGDSAAFYGGTWELSPLEEADVDFEWGVFPFPTMADAVHDARHGGGADQAFCLSADITPEKEELVYEFLEYVSRPEVATVYLEPENPIASSIVGVPEVDSPAAESLRETTYPDTVRFLDWMWPSAVTNEVANAISGVVGGELSPEQAANNVQDAYDRYKEDN